MSGIWDKVKLDDSWLTNVYPLSIHVNSGLGLNMLEYVQESSLYFGVKGCCFVPVWTLGVILLPV